MRCAHRPTAPLAGPIYGPPQDTTANPYITWRAYSGISSFTHPQNGHDYAVGCASDGILIVDVTANSVLGGPAVAAAVNGNWWWIPETGWSVTDIPEQRTSGTVYPTSSSNPLGHLMTTDTRNREAVSFVQNGAVFLYSVNYLRPGIWVMELPPPAAWPASGSNLVPTFSTWSFVPSGPGATAPGVVGATGLVPGGGTVVHHLGGGHTISIDKTHGQIYVCGMKTVVPDWSLAIPAGQFGGTMTVYNIAPANAQNLAYVGTLRTTTQQAFGSWTAPAATHDVQIFGNWCVVSVLDASPSGNLPGITTPAFPCWALINIANGWQGGASATMFSTFGFGPHSAWYDGRFLWGLIEDHAANLLIYDVQAPAAPPRVVASLTTPQAGGSGPAILHHIRGIGHTGFLAHYQDGVHVMDLSAGGGSAAIPLEQRLIANLDTSPLTYVTGAPVFDQFQGVWDVATDFDSGIVCATQIGSGNLVDPAGLLVLRYDIGCVNRYWGETPFPSGAPSPGVAPRIALPEGPPLRGQNLLVVDENWWRYPTGLGICYFSLTTPLAPASGPGSATFWNLIPASVLVQAVIVNPDTDVDATGVVYPAGHCVLSIPPAPWSLGWQIFCQIAVQDGSWFAASRGTWFGVGG